MTKDNLWKKYTEKQKSQVFKFSDGYKKYIDAAKTEREFVEITIEKLEKNGFTNIDKKKSIKKGDKIYFNNREKNIIGMIIGEEEISKGINMIVSHIDSPRLDLKPNPIMEDQEFAMLNTHYYGGIKKYQWGATPLALHGVIFLKNGKKITLKIGEKDTDPVFSIPDVLPHLSYKVQDDRKARDVLKGEELKLLFGNMPIKDDAKQPVKKFIMDKLKKDYGIEDEDFFTAEIQIVPAGKARDVGLDASMIGAYGQDDRVCAYTSMEAFYEVEKPKKTAMVYLADKEEVGSEGSTGLQSNFLEYALGKVLSMSDKNYNDQILRETLWNSRALSSDVTVGVDPIFKSIHDFDNAARLSYGIAMAKYTGHRGKSSSNDADAEFMQEIRQTFEKEKIEYQIGGFGKVDEGGGGTVAKFLANFGIRTVDAGPALLSMHSLFEISSKADVYETYRAYKAFYKMEK